MPTSLPRTQVLLQPDIHADVQTIAKHNRRSGSAMCSELIEAALKLPKYRQQIEEALIQVPAKEDPRNAIPQTQLRNGKGTKPDYLAVLNGEDGDIDPAKLEKLKQLIELIS